MRAGLAVLLVGLFGCNGPDTGQFGYNGYAMDTFFPFDGSRTWTFTNTDTTVPYKLVATLDTNFATLDDGTHVFTVNYTTHCPDTSLCTDGVYRIHDIQWSSDQAKGALIHGYDDDSGSVSFDPPLVMAGTQGKPAQSWTTTTNGADWTSTFQEIGDCPINLGVAWTDCVQLHVEDGGANSTLTGDWWVVSSYNVVAMQLAGDSGQWQLSDVTWTP